MNKFLPVSRVQHNIGEEARWMVVLYSTIMYLIEDKLFLRHLVSIYPFNLLARCNPNIDFLLEHAFVS